MGRPAEAMREESDSMGTIRVPADRYWGAQTQRSLENFRIGGERMPEPLIAALGIVKEAAARANMRLGLLDPKLGKKLLSDLAGTGTAVRRRNRVIRSRECQLRVVNSEAPALEVKQPSRSPEIMEQMAIDMEEIRVLAHASDDVLVPDLGQHRAARFCQIVLPLASYCRRHQPLAVALRGL